MSKAAPADVCLILEGTYPYVAGGVSTWTHDLICSASDLRFSIVALLARRSDRELRYKLPPNVVELSHIFIQELPRDRGNSVRGLEALCRKLEPALMRLQGKGGIVEIPELLQTLAPLRSRLGRQTLLNSPATWTMLQRMYNTNYPSSSFLDYFWTWRALLGGLYSVLLGDLPAARVYHAVSTGYAGLLAARAVTETRRPALVTENGIYTNERRVEIAMADWLFEEEGGGLTIVKPQRDLKDLWVDTFISYSRACYQGCARIITLYEGNQRFQMADGAPRERLLVIPNGIDVAKYSSVPVSTASRPPTIALIGRVVPIKDVKTFIRAVAMLQRRVPEVQAHILGPIDEDKEYFDDCQAMVAQMNLQGTVKFLGRVKLDEHLGRIDAIVLTSISEAQPLVILEAGAAGVPTVATDVGACREMILGRSDESPALGPGGAVTPLSNPQATAEALARLLTDPEWRAQCSHAIKARVDRYYNKLDQDRAYHDLYDAYRHTPDLPIGADMGSSWQV